MCVRLSTCLSEFCIFLFLASVRKSSWLNCHFGLKGFWKKIAMCKRIRGQTVAVGTDPHDADPLPFCHHSSHALWSGTMCVHSFSWLTSLLWRYPPSVARHQKWLCQLCSVERQCVTMIHPSLGTVFGFTVNTAGHTNCLSCFRRIPQFGQYLAWVWWLNTDLWVRREGFPPAVKAQQQKA